MLFMAEFKRDPKIFVSNRSLPYKVFYKIRSHGANGNGRDFGSIYSDMTGVVVSWF